MKLANLYLVLLFLSMPTLASEGKGVGSHDVESSKSLFAEAAGKSVLLTKSLTRTHFANYSLDDGRLELLSYLPKSNNHNFSEYRFKSDTDSKYRGLNHRSNYLDIQHVSPDALSDYLAHDMHSNEHFSFYSKEMKEHGWDIHDRWENHHICTPVPEPETYVMVLLGLLMIVVMKRRKT